MAFDRKGSARRRQSVAQPKAYVAIAEDHGDLFTVWETCLRNDAAGSDCPQALWCGCVRHRSGPTLRAEVQHYDSMAQAIACADVLNEPLLEASLAKTVPAPTREGCRGDGYRYVVVDAVTLRPDGGFIDEADVPF